MSMFTVFVITDYSLVCVLVAKRNGRELQLTQIIDFNVHIFGELQIKTDSVVGVVDEETPS